MNLSVLALSSPPPGGIQWSSSLGAVMMRKKLESWIRLEEVADEGQQVDVSLAPVEEGNPLYRARLASQYKGRKGILKTPH